MFQDRAQSQALLATGASYIRNVFANEEKHSPREYETLPPASRCYPSHPLRNCGHVPDFYGRTNTRERNKMDDSRGDIFSTISLSVSVP